MPATATPVVECTNHHSKGDKHEKESLVTDVVGYCCLDGRLQHDERRRPGHRARGRKNPARGEVASSCQFSASSLPVGSVILAATMTAVRLIIDPTHEAFVASCQFDAGVALPICSTPNSLPSGPVALSPTMPNAAFRSNSRNGVPFSCSACRTDNPAHSIKSASTSRDGLFHYFDISIIID